MIDAFGRGSIWCPTIYRYFSRPAFFVEPTVTVIVTRPWHEMNISKLQIAVWGLGFLIIVVEFRCTQFALSQLRRSGAGNRTITASGV